MGKIHIPPSSLRQWTEFCWLWFSDPTFRQSRNKRKAYHEHCMAKSLAQYWF